MGACAMEPVSIQQAAMDAQNEIRAAMDRFIKTIEDSIVSPETFLDIEQLEREWHTLRTETDKTYAELISSVLSRLDDGELIKRKKANT